MKKEYYKEYFYLERNHWWFVVRSKILKAVIHKFVSANSSLSILNVGVATGATTEMLSEFGEVTSIEYDPDCCDFMNKHSQIKVINGSILDLPGTDNAFDLVCCFDVIEHVEDHHRAVNELFRVCKQN